MARRVGQNAMECGMASGYDADDRDLDTENVETEADESSHRGLSELVRRALMSGVGAVLMSEDTIRNTVQDLRLPKEMMGSLLGQADKTKREITNVVSREVRGFLDNIELQDILTRVLSNVNLEVTMKVAIVPKEDGNLGMEVVKTGVSAGQKGAKAPAKRTRKRAARKSTAKKATSKRTAKKTTKAAPKKPS